MFYQTCQTVQSITVNIKTILSSFSFQNPENFINTATFKKVNNKIPGGQSSVAGSAAFSLEQIFPPSLALWHPPPPPTLDSQAAVRSCLGWVTARVKTWSDPNLRSCSVGPPKH